MAEDLLAIGDKQLGGLVNPVPPQLKVLLLLVVLLLTSAPGVYAGSPGDWPMDRHDPGNTGDNFGETALQPPLRLRWSASASTGGASPVIAGGLVYATTNGYLSALDTSTGATMWTANIGGGSIVLASPIVTNGLLYIGGYSSSSTLYALDARTGALLWNDVFDCCIDSAPMAAGGSVYMGTRDGQVRALDGTTGAVKWTYSIGQAIAHFSTPSVSGGLVFLESQEANHVGRLRALDAGTGELIWTYGSLLWSGHAPVVVDGTVYLTDGSTTVGALDAQSGSVKWLVHPGGVFLAAPAVSDGVVYVSDHWGLIYALDAGTGGVKWSHQLDWPKDGSSTPAPVVANGLVYVPGVLGQFSAIVALDALTGEYRWSFSGTPDVISYAPKIAYTQFTPAAVADGVLYTGSHGVLYALENDVSIPNLSVGVMAARERIYPGEALGYLITMDNSGDAGISVAVTDTIPSGASFISGTLTGGAVYSPTINSVLWSGTVYPAQSSLPSAIVSFRVAVSDTTTNSLIFNAIAAGNGTVRVTSTIATPIWRRSYLPLLPKDPAGW